MRRQEKLASEVAALGDLSRDELVGRWIRAHGTPPPKGIRQQLLLRSAAWHVQKRRLGRLSAEAGRLLKAAMRRVEESRAPHAGAGGAAEPGPIAVSQGTGVARSLPSSSSDAAPAVRSAPIALKPGARLVREWKGRMNVVEVTADGFVHEGKTYRSLSAIARRITGAHWSGPRFFGL